ncbi:hypothetical protein CCACVL1_01135 [Corchorus capsularis]|uniref:Uncharacterized protein n=1 Tax=Corchorus capsularis TaxID=210143 RepID=A0A1R3KMG6_COCAP|nr:hypothetical protein CCACVL1_01135 [Corchorus capsularis]
MGRSHPTTFRFAVHSPLRACGLATGKEGAKPNLQIIDS